MQTTTHTTTITDARYVAVKIAADLKRLQRLSGRGVPSDETIQAHLQEVQQLLHGGYLGTVTYGFRKGDKWIVALQYTAVGSDVSHDHDPGGIRFKEDVSGASFYSFLTYSYKWFLLSEAGKRAVEAQLPFQRSSGSEPYGEWGGYDNNYRSNGIGVRRRGAGI